MDRIGKAIKYVNGHISKETFARSKNIIIADIIKFKKNPNVSVHGSSCQFVRVLQNRFPIGFYPDEYLLIINAINNKLTQKQREHYKRN
mgnify:FL=1